jgi:hypothetical protein
MANSWAGFWGTGVNAYSLLRNKNPRRYAIKRVVNRDSFRVMTALSNALIGAASGSATGAITFKRINPGTPLDAATFGGRRTIDTVSIINRNTTAADVTALKEMLYNVKTRPAPYVRDLSGNGGPAYT